MTSNPGALLASLIAVATLAGGILYNKHAPAAQGSTSQQIRALEKELDILKAENKTLKSIHAVNGEITLPLEFYTFVEQNLKLQFFPHLKAIKTDQDKLEEAAEYRWIKQFNQAGVENRQYAFELLGIQASDSLNYAKQLAALETNADLGRLGVYDVAAKELLLNNQFNIENNTHQVELIRLLSIALLEAHYPAANDLTDDAFLTRDAIIRGRAEMIANRYLNIANRDEKPSRLVVEQPQDASPLVKTIEHFTRVDGRDYIEEILVKKRNVFPELYQHIPQQSAFIYLDVPFITTLNKPRKKYSAKPTERVLIDGEFGQVLVRTLIGKLSEDHAELYLELAYDSVLFLQNTDQPEYPSIEWKITWTGEDSAKTFTELFNAKSQYTIAQQKGNVVIITAK